MNRSQYGVWLALIAVFLLSSTSASAQETSFTHQSFDGFGIDAKAALPQGAKPDEVTRVIVLVPGSGTNGMDLDLTVAAKDRKTPILFFKDLSDELSRRGFAVVRYKKRNYQLNEMVKRVKGRNGSRPPTRRRSSGAFRRTRSSISWTTRRASPGARARPSRRRRSTSSA